MSIDPCWNTFHDGEGVVAFFLDVYKAGVRFSIGSIGAVVEIKRDVQKVYNFFVDFDRYIEAMLLRRPDGR